MRLMRAALLVAAALITGAALWWRSRRRQVPPSDGGTIVLPPPMAPPPPVTARAQPATAAIAAGWGGFVACVLAQMALLASRDPLPPLLGFGIGVALLIPLVDRQALPRHDAPQRHDLGLGIVIALLIVFLHLLTIGVMGAFFALVVAALSYALGLSWGGRWAGLGAAGVAATSGWTLALGRIGSESVLLAAFAGLFLVGLMRRDWRFALVSAFGLGAGAGIEPTFAVLGLLLVFTVSGRRDLWRIGRFVLAALFIALPFWIAAPSPLPSPPAPGDPAVSFSEALATHLLMFNLAADPNPLHGLVGRPAFAPVAAAALLVGLLVLAWRIDRSRNWRDLLPLVALVVALVPATLWRDLPPNFPHLLRAAPALPVACALAGCGFAPLAAALSRRWGRVGDLLAACILTALLALLALDARAHYVTIALPLLRGGG